MLYALTCSALWAGVTVAGKILSSSTPAVIFAFLRFTIAVVCLLPFIRKVDYHRVNLRYLGFFLLLGLTGVFLFNCLFFSALRFTSATTVSLILSTHPVLTLVINSIIHRHIPTKYQLLVFALSLVGVAMVITQGKFGYALFSGNTGEMLMLAAVLSQITYTLTLKKIAGHFSAPFLTFATGISGLLFLSPILFNHTILDEMVALKLSHWMLFGYVGIFGTAIAVILYSVAVHKIGPTKTSLVVFSTMPIFVFILSFLLLGETISGWQMGGGALVLCALLISLSTE